MSVSDVIGGNLERVRGRIARACANAGRDPSDVRLVAVTKYAELDWVRELVALGVRELGESRPQQLLERAERLPGATWHLVGHLQRNKVRKVLPVAALIHSVDGTRLAEAIDRIAGELDLVPRLLLEVNVAGEASKHGFGVDELRSAWEELRALPNVRFEGLMTMAPLADDPRDVRPVFRRLRELREELRDRDAGGHPLGELSMGTSHDFDAAVEEGATTVRVGRTLFDGLEAGA